MDQAASVMSNAQSVLYITFHPRSRSHHISAPCLPARTRSSSRKRSPPQSTVAHPPRHGDPRGPAFSRGGMCPMQ
ncbi:hypothetical protein JB92DRAFT_2975712 [Gautieria morchelliformis]|nr:hypothetical protein JB92DRAFT_2975712 [Gautieria morchelliformis]